MSKIKIAFGITEDWIKYSFVTICSILAHSLPEDDYKFYIMSDISENEFKTRFEKIYKTLIEKFSKSFEIEYVKMNNSDFDGIIHDTRVGISALYRLKLASITKEDKILYLDSDIVVLDNIAELWENNVENYLIGAVEDKYSSLMTCQADLEDDDIYINSGVMLMNLKKFRKEKIENKIFEKLKEENNNFSDQDVLNNICKNEILYLPLKYNLMLTRDDPNAFPTRKEEYKKALQNPYILHFSIKPWILPVQYSEYWYKYNEFINIK